jgi:hypothetical protein
MRPRWAAGLAKDRLFEKRVEATCLEGRDPEAANLKILGLISAVDPATAHSNRGLDQSIGTLPRCTISFET